MGNLESLSRVIWWNVVEPLPSLPPPRLKSMVVEALRGPLDYHLSDLTGLDLSHLKTLIVVPPFQDPSSFAIIDEDFEEEGTTL